MPIEGEVLNHRYQILRVLSDKGGMGVIYQATDLTFNNTVVIKHSRFTEQFLKQQYPAMPPDELRSHAEYLRKAFEREARLVRGLKHHALPNVIDYFTTGDGHQFFVMDFIPGKDFGELLDERLRQNRGPFPLDQALDWADQLLDALDYLHTRFDSPIIHRDLKPLNLKLTPDGRIVLLDFGLAKGATPGMSVVSASIHGYTLNYAPLEQIRGKGTSVRSDLYSLAVTLHHLLSGAVPPSAVDRIAETTSGEADPLRPLHEINPQIPDVVSEVIQRAAAVNPSERYKTATEMLEAFRQVNKLAGEQRAAPVINKQLTALPSKTSQALSNIIDQAALIDESSATLERYSPLSSEVGQQPKPFSPPIVVNLGSLPDPSLALPTKPVVSVQLEPQLTLPASRRCKLNSLFRRKVGITALSLVIGIVVIAGIYMWQDDQSKQTLTGHNGSVNSVAFSPDGNTLASGSGDKTVKLWWAQTGVLKQTLTGHSDEVNSVTFSPDGGTLASGSVDKTVKLWDARSGALKQTLTGHNDSVNSVAFSPDGKTLASGSNDKTVTLWDTQTWALKQTLTGHTDVVNSVAFSPDGKTLASGSGSDDKNLKLWDIQSGALKHTLGHFHFAKVLSLNRESANRESAWKTEISGEVMAVAFSPDGKTLASMGGDFGDLKLWDVQTWALKQTLTGHTDVLNSVAFSPDGKMLAIGGGWEKNILTLWDAQTGVLKQTLAGHDFYFRVLSVAFSPDGKTLASGSADKTVRLWVMEH